MRSFTEAGTDAGGRRHPLIHTSLWIPFVDTVYQECSFLAAALEPGEAFEGVWWPVRAGTDCKQ